MRPWIDRLFGLSDILQRFMWRTAPPDVGQPPVVRNPKHKRSLGTFAAKVSQRLPDRRGHLLHQFFPNTRHGLVAVSQPRDGGSVLAENPIELLFQSMAAFAHGLSLAGIASQVKC